MNGKINVSETFTEIANQFFSFIYTVGFLLFHRHIYEVILCGS